MLQVFVGTDREKARVALRKAAGQSAVYITDSHTVADLRAALAGGGMFGGKRTVILDGICANDEMKEVLLASLPMLKSSPDLFFIFEEKVDAATKKLLAKHAEKVETFDAPKAKDDRGDVFAIANALKRGDKKAMWVEYQRALARGDAPEAIHGILFWGAKDMLLKAPGTERSRAAGLVASLAELPHEARRTGFELEYALERFLLGINKML